MFGRANNFGRGWQLVGWYMVKHYLSAAYITGCRGLMQCSGCVVFGAFRERLVQLSMYITRDRQTYCARLSKENWGTQESSPQGAPSDYHGQPVSGPKVQSGCSAELAPRGTRAVRQNNAFTGNGVLRRVRPEGPPLIAMVSHVTGP